MVNCYVRFVSFVVVTKWVAVLIDVFVELVVAECDDVWWVVVLFQMFC